MTMRLLLLPLVLLAAPVVAELPYDHHEPVTLNEYAVRAAREGDIATAMILLERAVRLNPGDPRLAGNLEILRCWQSGDRGLPPAPLARQAQTAPAATGAPATAAEVAAQATNAANAANAADVAAPLPKVPTILEPPAATQEMPSALPPLWPLK